MFTTKKKKSVILCVFSLVLMVVLVIALGAAGRACAAEKTMRTIASFLGGREIQYTEVNIDNQTLSVRLLSTGEERCTLDDVKAIQSIYEAVHAQTIEGKVKNIRIEIYNANGKLIYDIFENDVSSHVEGVNQLIESNSKDERLISANEVLLQVDDIVEGFPYSVQKSYISTSTEIPGNKLELTLCESKNSVSFISDIRGIYENLESYSFSSNAITQCEITVEDIDGECLMYMAGDFQYGNCIAWVSPEAESSLLVQEGPQQTD